MGPPWLTRGSNDPPPPKAMACSGWLINCSNYRGGGGCSEKAKFGMAKSAQQNCTKSCRGILRTKASFLCVILSRSRCAQPPESMTATIQKPTFALCACSCATIWSFCTKILQYYSRIGANFSPHQILPFQILHVPTPPPPAARSRGTKPVILLVHQVLLLKAWFWSQLTARHA